MSKRVIVLGQLAGRLAAALMIDGRVEDLVCDPPPERPRRGTLYRAKVGRPVKGAGGTFVELGGGLTGFLRNAGNVAPGAPVLVQVSGFASDGKAVPVTRKPAVKGRYGVLTPGAPGRNVSRAVKADETRARLAALGDTLALPEGTGLILRTEAAEAGDGAILRELEALSAELEAAFATEGAPVNLLDGPDAHRAALTDWGPADSVDPAPDSFGMLGVSEAIDGFLTPRCPLPGGAAMMIEPTAALVAVDVNTGGDTSPAAGLKANLAAARELPRQLRCRGLGGQITIDAAPMPRRDRQRVEQALTAAFRGDPDETTLAGWTPLGHCELQRRRSRLPLREALL